MKDEEYSPYQTILWDDYKTDYKSPEENKSFWVVVPKTEIDNFVNDMHIDLDTQLFGFEWPARDDFRFLLDSEKAEPFHVFLGHKDSLMFQDFQIHFEVKRNEFLAILHNLRDNIDNIDNFLTDLLRIAIIPKESGSKTLENILADFPELVKLENKTGSQVLSNNLSIEDFIFEELRVVKCCNKCSPNGLEFPLTYRNSDIVRAMKGGVKSLEDYLKNTPCIKFASPRVQQTLLLLFPSYLKSYNDYWNQVCSDHEDEFYSKRNLDWVPLDKNLVSKIKWDLKFSSIIRKDLKLEDVWNVLCILTNKMSETTERFRNRFDEKLYFYSQIQQRITKLLETIDPTEHKDTTEDAAKCDNDAYFKFAQKYFSLTQAGTDDLCRWVHWLKSVKDTFRGIPRCDHVSSYDLYSLLDHLLGYVERKDESTWYNGLLPRYFPLAIGNESQDAELVPIISDRTDLPLEYQEKVYKAYLVMNDFFSLISSWLSCFPMLHSRMNFLAEYFLDVEYQWLKKLFFDKRFTDDEKQAFIDSVIKRENIIVYPYPFHRIPEYHRSVIESFERRVAEKKLVKIEAQRDVFMKVGHSIKNLINSVVSPLDSLKDKLTGQPRNITENALAGTNLIRNLAQAMHMSLREGSWRKDIENPGQDPASLNSILFKAFYAALINMFDGKYFKVFLRNYFHRDEQLFHEAKQQCLKDQSEEDFFECVNQYFFEFKCEYKGNSAIPIGDAEGTATKLLILFQELFLNAVKYSSYIDRKARFVHIHVDVNADRWSFIIRNSALQTDSVNPSGIGLSIIKYFTKLFNAEFSSELTSGVYQSKLNFTLKEESKNA